MPRLRRAGVLLLVCAAAVVLAWLRAPQDPDFPPGSTRSTAPDGAGALFLWVEALERRPLRLERLTALAPGTPDTVLVLQPLLPIDAEARRALDAVAGQGGTLIVAGDTPAMQSYVQTLGVEARATPRQERATVPHGGPTVPVQARLRLSAQGSTPLLLALDGDVLALRRPYLAGEVAVISSLVPFTNDGLRDVDTARFVHDLLFGFPSGAAERGVTVAFDETHYALQTTGGESVPSFGQLLRGTAPGRAILYAGLLTFTFLLLAGQRPGPPLPPAAATAPNRTMAEQVQALAGLYRRAGQFDYLRNHFALQARHKVAQAAGVEAGAVDVADPEVTARLIARGVPPDRASTATAMLRQIETSRSEGQLLEAVNHMEALLADLSASGSATLTRR